MLLPLLALLLGDERGELLLKHLRRMGGTLQLALAFGLVLDIALAPGIAPAPEPGIMGMRRVS